MNTSEAPVCSVCIANYNGENLLAECIDSIRVQQGDITTEIIVHDDASTDQSLALLRNYPEVRVIESAENVGFCTANNRMVAAARGEFVLLLNNDAALYPDAIEKLLASARDIPDGGILTLDQHDWQDGRLVDRGCLLDPFYNPVPNLDPDRHEVAMVIGACLWIPRSLWHELGGFPEWMGSLAEDMYLCCAARQRNLPVRVVSGSGYRHWQGRSFGGNRIDEGRLDTTYRRRALSEFNKTCVMLVFTPAPVLPVLFMLHAVLLLLEGVFLSIAKLSLKPMRIIYLGTLVRIVRQGRTMMSRRRMLSRARRAGGLRFFSAFTFMPRKLVLLIRYGIPRIR